jgi:putative hydrolase of the HAD superfamily
MFRSALDAMGISPDAYRDVVMVGNNLQRDIKGANAMGLITIWFHWNDRYSVTFEDRFDVPDHTISVFTELIGVIDGLNQ